MLVLSRSEGERVTIGDDVEVLVIETSEQKVKFGIVAPAGVKILRDDAKGDENGTRRGKTQVFGHACQNLQERAKEVFQDASRRRFGYGEKSGKRVG